MYVCNTVRRTKIRVLVAAIEDDFYVATGVGPRDVDTNFVVWVLGFVCWIFFLLEDVCLGGKNVGV